MDRPDDANGPVMGSRKLNDGRTAGQASNSGSRTSGLVASRATQKLCLRASNLAVETYEMDLKRSGTRRA